MKKEGITIAIRIITDSTCDLSPEDQALFNIQVIPLSVQFLGVSYLDGIDITKEQFFEKLDACEKLPTTSQVPPQTFINEFRKHLDAGDEVVGIFISSDISGTYNSARLAKDALGSDKLFIVDSRSTTIGLALLALEAAKHRDAGFSAAQIAEHVTALSKNIRLLVALNTLKYVRMGGRISSATAVVGEVLGIKPIVGIIDGTIHVVGKARGMQAALKVILQEAQAELPDLRYSVAFAHSCASHLIDKAVACLKEPLQLGNYLICNAGSVVGTYAGRGAVGFAYIAR